MFGFFIIDLNVIFLLISGFQVSKIGHFIASSDQILSDAITLLEKLANFHITVSWNKSAQNSVLDIF